MNQLLLSGLFTLSVVLSGCTTYTQDANGNVLATTVVPVPLVDDVYDPLVSDYVGLPFLNGWDGWSGRGYYNSGYYNANWNHANWNHANWNRGVLWRPQCLLQSRAHVPILKRSD